MGVRPFLIGKMLKLLLFFPFSFFLFLMRMLKLPQMLLHLIFELCLTFSQPAETWSNEALVILALNLRSWLI